MPINVKGSKGLRPLAGFGAEPRLSSQLPVMAHPIVKFFEILVIADGFSDGDFGLVVDGEDACAFGDASGRQDLQYGNIVDFCALVDILFVKL